MQSAVPEISELPPLDAVVDIPKNPRGKRWYPPIFTGEPRQVSLSPRMADVLVGVMKGLTAKQIGKALFLTEDTIKTHAKRLYQQLDARNQAHAVALFTTGEVEVYVSEPPPRRRRLIALHEPDEL